MHTKEGYRKDSTEAFPKLAEKAESIDGSLPLNEEDNRFMFGSGSTAMRPELEGVIERVICNDNEIFELIKFWGEEEIQVLEN